MVKIKSLSVGNWDMFYIKHWSDNFSIIDCCLNDENKELIVGEIIEEKKWKSITRVISTHPDQDHISWLKYLNEKIDILNFYCVQNEATKNEETDDFKEYCILRDNPKKTFYISEWVKRKWMNETNDERWWAWINVLWPIIDNEFYLDELDKVKEWESPNNISPIFTYHLNDWLKVIWMWDLENEFMEKILDNVTLSKCNILIAPHHWRKSWKVPDEWLEKINPDIIIMWEAPSENLDYASYNDYNKITQNSAKDITFICETWKTHIYVSNESYSVNFLSFDADYIDYPEEWHYIWTLYL